MASTRFAVGSDETVKVWSKLADAVALPKTSLGRVSGMGQNNIVQIKDELKKGRGDRVRFFLRQLASGDGVTEGQTLEGNEEGLQYYSDDLLINQLRHATKWESEGISEQRVLLDLRQDAMSALTEWSRDRFDNIFFNHLCGNTSIENLANPALYNGHNPIVDYDANHTVRPNSGTNTNDQTLNGNSSDTFDLGLLDTAIEKAKTMDIPLRPINVGGQELYLVFLHPYQVTSLRNTSSRWYTEMRNAMQGGMVNDNPIFTGSLGTYNGCLLIENNRVTTGVHSSTGVAQPNVRRAVLAGAQSCTMAFGRYGSEDPTRLKWIEETFDYKEHIGIGIKFVMGLKRCIYNSESYGSIVIPTYAAAA